MGSIRIYIFALLPVTIAGLKLFLKSEKHIRITGYSDDYSSIGDYLKKHPNDILIIDDTCFEKEEFISLLNSISKYLTGNKIILYTGSNDAVYLKYIIDRGVRGIIHKKSSKEKILEAIQLLELDNVYYDNDINYLIYNYKLRTKEIENDPKLKLFSNREKEIVNLISLDYSNKMISDKLSISVKTVENHKERIKNKLGIKKIEDLYSLIKNK